MKWRDVSKTYRDNTAILRAKSAHEILRVPTNASQEQIRAAYKRLVKAYHPDTADEFVRRSNEEVLKLITVAYRSLTGK